MTTLQDALLNRLLTIPGMEERGSKWQDSDALRYRGKEIIHFDQPNLVDLRLGRRAIQEHRGVELKDDRVKIRGQSDWVNVRLEVPEDVEFVIGLVRNFLWTS
jgi:hypothetical protein